MGSTLARVIREPPTEEKAFVSETEWWGDKAPEDVGKYALCKPHIKGCTYADLLYTFVLIVLNF